MGADSARRNPAGDSDHYGGNPHVNDLFNRLGDTCLFYRGGGLGDYIFIGLNLYQPEYIIGGAVPVTILAIIIDYVLAVTERKVTPKGLQGMKEVS